MTITELIALVCRYYNAANIGCSVNVEDVMSRSSYRPVVHCRQIAMYILRRNGVTYEAIGRAMGRDHSTAVYAVRMVSDMVQTGAPEARVLATCMTKIGIDTTTEFVTDLPKPKDEGSRRWINRLKAQASYNHSEMIKARARSSTLLKELRAMRAQVAELEAKLEKKRAGSYHRVDDWTPEQRMVLNELRKTHAL